MKILGFDFGSSESPVTVKGTAFEARTAAAMEAIQAAAPKLPPQALNDVNLYSMPAYRSPAQQANEYIPPFGTNPPRTQSATLSTELEERTIHNDPRELWYLALPYKLTPQQCLQIMRAALGGDIWQQWQLLSLMMDTWPTFRKAAHELREAVAYAKYNVHPFAEDGEEPTESAKERAGLVSRAIKGMNPNSFNDEHGFSGMAYDLTDAMLNGLSMVELIWEDKTVGKKGRERLPRASAWVHPRHFTYTMEGEIAVFDDSYSRLYFNPQISSNQARVGQSPDPRKFLCAQFISRSGSALGAGFMRPLVWYWAARQFNNEWMLNTAKQYGSPFLDLTYKPGTPTAEIEALKQLASKAGPERRIVHPEGSTATILPAQSLGKENPQRYLTDEADAACLYLLLGQKGTTAATAGALGNQETHENVKDERVQGLANWLARNPLRQFARAVLMVNYGDCDECPSIEADFTRPLSAPEVGALCSAISGSGVPIRADEFYRKTGFTQPEEKDIVLVRGEIKIQGKPLTDEEKFDQQLNQQVQQAETQMDLQAEAAGGQPQPGKDNLEASEKRRTQSNANGLTIARRIPTDASLAPIVRGKNKEKLLQQALQQATLSELAELEVLATEARHAPHLNGEQARFEQRVAEIASRKG